MVKLSSGIELNPNELTSEDREAIVKALEETKSRVWKPERGDNYWLVNYGDNVIESPWANDSYDNSRLAIGNVFPTKKAAEKHLTYLKALQVLRGDTKGYEYEKGDQYYCVWYDTNDDDLDWDDHTAVLVEGIKFASKEDAQSSAAAHEKEWRTVLLGE